MDAAVFEADEVGSGGGEGGRHGRSVGGCRRRLSISIRETTLHRTTRRRAGMDSDGTQPVLVRRDGAVVLVTLNQPASLNALSAGIKDGIETGLPGLLADPGDRRSTRLNSSH